MNATATIAPAGPQYMRALDRATQVRLARAELKRRVALGDLCVAAVILDCPWEADSMAVADLLMSQRRWGQTRCRKFLAQIAMSEKKTVGSMTERQRRTLAAMLTAVPPTSCGDQDVLAQGEAQAADFRAQSYRAPAEQHASAQRSRVERRAMALSH